MNNNIARYAAVSMYGLIIVLALVWIVAVAGCNKSSDPPAPSVFAGALPSPWIITAGSAGVQGTALGPFPQCVSASTCWMSYAESSLPVQLNVMQVLTVVYTISGNNPKFVNDSPGNTCGGPAAISLMLHQAGDNMSGQGAFEFYRWFSLFELAQPLALGTHTFTISLNPANWISVYAKNGATVPANYANALLHLGSVGIVFGGGCFAGHGVAVSSGSASFSINNATIQ